MPEKSFETITLAELESLDPRTRARYERWFASWMANGFALRADDTFDIEVERRDGWGYQLEEHRP